MKNTNYRVCPVHIPHILLNGHPKPKTLNPIFSLHRGRHLTKGQHEKEESPAGGGSAHMLMDPWMVQLIHKEDCG